jgi:hypothetical protein
VVPTPDVKVGEFVLAFQGPIKFIAPDEDDD